MGSLLARAVPEPYQRDRLAAVVGGVDDPVCGSRKREKFRAVWRAGFKEPDESMRIGGDEVKQSCASASQYLSAKLSPASARRKRKNSRMSYRACAERMME